MALQLSSNATNRGLPKNQFRMGTLTCKPGTELEGFHENDFRLKILGRLGGGTYGESFVVVDRLTGRHMTLKKYRGDISRQTKKAVAKAIEIHKKTGETLPPGTMQTHIKGDLGNQPILFSYEEGTDFERQLDVIDGMDIPDAIDASKQTVLAALRNLEELRQAGIVHRDIAPANVLHGSGTLLDTDFLIRKGEQDGLLTGHDWYCAPETFGGNNYSAASDLYSLGVIGATAITGRTNIPDFVKGIKDMQAQEYGGYRGHVPRISNRAKHRMNFARNIMQEGVSASASWTHMFDSLANNAKTGGYIRMINAMMAKRVEDRPKDQQECLSFL